MPPAFGGFRVHILVFPGSHVGGVARMCQRIANTHHLQAIAVRIKRHVQAINTVHSKILGSA